MFFLLQYLFDLNLADKNKKFFLKSTAQTLSWNAGMKIGYLYDQKQKQINFNQIKTIKLAHGLVASALKFSCALLTEHLQLIAFYGD